MGDDGFLLIWEKKTNDGLSKFNLKLLSNVIFFLVTVNIATSDDVQI